jgi:hypothetical protein
VSHCESTAILSDLAARSRTFRVLYCPAFERNWGAIARCRVQPTLVLGADVPRERAAERGLGGKDHPTRQFDRERVKERLGVRIVTRPARTRGSFDAARSCHNPTFKNTCDGMCCACSAAGAMYA